MLKKRNRVRKTINVFLGVSILICGIIIGKLIDWPMFKVDKNVNLVDLFSIVITFLIAYFIARVIEKQKEDYREEKNLLINKLDEVFNIIDETSEKVDTRQIKYQEAASKVKRININLTCIFTAINKSSIIIDEEDQKEISRKVINLRNLLTNTPRIDEGSIKKSNLPLEVKSGIIHISETRVIEIETEFNKLKNLIFGLQMKVNSS